MPQLPLNYLLRPDVPMGFSGGVVSSMADLLLTHGYFLHEDEKEREIMKPYPPLGLLYL